MSKNEILKKLLEKNLMFTIFKNLEYIIFLFFIIINEVKNKKIVFRTRDANSSINILKLTKCWINNQTRPTEFQSHISSFTFSPTKEKKKK